MVMVAVHLRSGPCPGSDYTKDSLVDSKESGWYDWGSLEFTVSVIASRRQVMDFCPTSSEVI